MALLGHAQAVAQLPDGTYVFAVYVSGCGPRNAQCTYAADEIYTSYNSCTNNNLAGTVPTLFFPLYYRFIGPFDCVLAAGLGLLGQHGGCFDYPYNGCEATGGSNEPMIVQATKANGHWLPYTETAKGPVPPYTGAGTNDYSSHYSVTSDGLIVGSSETATHSNWNFSVLPPIWYDGFSVSDWTVDMEAATTSGSFFNWWRLDQSCCVNSPPPCSPAETIPGFVSGSMRLSWSDLWIAPSGLVSSPSTCPPMVPGPIRFIDPQATPFWSSHLPSDVLAAKEDALGIAADGTSLAVLAMETADDTPVTFEICVPASGCAGGPTSSLDQGSLLEIDAFATDGTTQLKQGRSTLEVTPVKVGSQFYAFALYHAPSALPATTSAANYGSLLKTVVHLAAVDGVGALVTQEISLAAPPLLTVHGLWSKGEAWRDLINYLQPRYGALLFSPVDYSKYNAYDFSGPEIQGRFKAAIGDALAKASQQRMIATRVDVVAHSMGGLVSRAFAAATNYKNNPPSYNQGRIYRLVTVGTPHKGTPIAKFLVQHAASLADPDSALACDPVFPTLPTCTGSGIAQGVTEATLLLGPLFGKDISQGAVEAMQPVSEAGSKIGALADFVTLPYRAIIGLTPPGSGAQATFDVLLSAFDGILFPAQQTYETGLLGSDNDTLVPAASQAGDATTLAKISGIVHTVDVPTLFGGTSLPGETSSDRVWAQILCYLSEGQVCTNSSTPNARREAPRAQIQSVPIGAIDFSAMTRLDPGVLTVTPSSGSAVTAGQPTGVTASAPGKNLTRVIWFAGGGLNDQTSSPFGWNLTTEAVGSLSIYVVALFDDNTYTVKTVTYQIQAPSDLVAVVVDPERLTFTNVGSSLSLNPSALYANGLVVDIRAGASYSIQSGTSNVATVSSTGDVTASGRGTDVVVVSFGGLTASARVTVVVPAVGVEGDSVVCAGQNVAFRATADAFPPIVYQWRRNAVNLVDGGTLSGSSGAILSITPAALSDAGTYDVVVTDGVGQSSTSSALSLAVSPGPIPTAPIASNNGPICAGQALQLNASTVAGATYSWTGPNGFRSALQNPTILAATTAATGTYSVAVTVGCPSPAGATAVVVNPTPATPVIVAPAVVRADTQNFASVVSHPGSAYAWSVENGTITAGQGTGRITFTEVSAGTLTLSVTETDALGCVSPPGKAAVTVTPSGSADVFYALPPCRVLDTRNAAGPLGGPALQPGATRTFDMATSSCGIPPGAVAISGNLTVTNVGAQGELVVFPSDVTRPNTNSLSFRPARTRANNAIVKLSDSSMTFSVFNNSAGNVDFIFDVNGYFK